VNQFGLTQSPTGIQEKLRRSMGVKLLIVCGLALVMTIPSFFVESLLEERTARKAEVLKEISAHVGGQQTFLGPTLAIPYTIQPDSRSGVYLVFPAQATAAVHTQTEERRRSLFRVPVFQADLKMDASFDLSGVPGAAPDGAQFDWSRAEVIVGVSDARGAQSDAVALIDGKSVVMAPARVSPDMNMNAEQGQAAAALTLFGVGAAGVAKPGAQFNVSTTLRSFGGSAIGGSVLRQDDASYDAGRLAQPGVRWRLSSGQPDGDQERLLGGVVGSVHCSWGGTRGRIRCDSCAGRHSTGSVVCGSGGPVPVGNALAQVSAAVPGAGVSFLLRI
jgi:hypothetical protein